LANTAAAPTVVFTTAYDEYAMDAFDAQAVGYILKPVRLERLRQALRQAACLSAAQLRGLAKSDHEGARRRNIAARVGDRIRLIPVSQVILFRADQKYVCVVHRNGEDLIDESLKDLADEFADSFLRIHRSILVNAAQVESLEKDPAGKYFIRLRAYAEAYPVSRRQVGELKRYLRSA
jgi:two-component system response regulator AlgR